MSGAAVNARAVRPPATELRSSVVVPFRKTPFDWETLLPGPVKGKTVEEYGAGNETVFMQGQPADALFFVLQGKVRLTVVSHGGKEGIVATLGPGEFFGEGCLAGQTSRMATATAVGDCTLTRVETATMARMLVEGPALSGVFINHLLTRTIRYEADLADQLFNSSEKRLARTLLLLSHFGPDSVSEPVVRGISQEHLAQMVGTTRSRINFFMNKFRKLGYVTYNAKAGLIVHRSLRSVTLRD
jgi:CRP/FNR family transcriptional regulator, cyclic AMP receptor protein